MFNILLKIDYRGTWMHWWSVCQVEDKTEHWNNKIIMFSGTLKKTTNKPALFLYSIQLSYFPVAKFLVMTFHHKFTFKKHFEDIMELYQQKYHCLRMSVNQKWGPSRQTILQIYKQCVRPILEYRVNFHNNRFGYCHHQSA